MAWGRRRKDVEEQMPQVGIVTLTAHIGRFHCIANTAIYGDVKVLGDDLDALHFDVDYKEAHAALVESIHALAAYIKTDAGFKEMMME